MIKHASEDFVLKELTKSLVWMKLQQDVKRKRASFLKIPSTFKVNMCVSENCVPDANSRVISLNKKNSNQDVGY